MNDPATRFASILLACGLALGAGCTTGARQGAAQGAAFGMIGGAAAGAVSSLLFGGNVLEGAVKGGVATAAGGAAAGAVAGGVAEKQAGQGKASASDKSVEALRKKLGDLNFQAAALLVQCKHDDAIKMANRALDGSDKQDQKIFALTIRAAAEAESGDDKAAEKTYAQIAALDDKRPVDKASADTLQVLIKVKGIRKDNGIKPCGG